MLNRWTTGLAMAFLTTVLGCSGEIQPRVPQGLAALSEDERLAVMGQGNCPVNGTVLGESAPPIKVSVKGKQFFVCSDACKAEFEKNSAKYLSIATQ